MFKFLRGLLAFLTLRLMLLPLTAILLFAGLCFIFHRPAERVEPPAPADQATVVPAADTSVGGAETAPLGFSDHMRGFSAGWRVLIWLAVVGGLPFAFVKIVQWSVGQDSNTANGVLLLGLSAAAILLSLFLMGFRLAGGWEIAILCLAAVLAALYNFVACEWLASRSA